MDKAQEELILSLIGWTQLALIGLNIYLAYKRGRNKVLWFFLTLLFSVFATVMLLLIKPEKQEQIQ
jgi:hypothetical protein